MAKHSIVYGQEYWDFDFGRFHPMRPFRVKLAFELIKDMGLLKNTDVVEPREAKDDELLNFHTLEYLEKLKEEKEATEFGLGTDDNPVLPGIFRYASLSVGGTLKAIEEVLNDAVVAFNLGGGMHHAKSNKASGFCYLNDVVIGIKRLLDEGLRVFYLDIDAHHGDAVQEAFYEDNRVFFLSVHQENAFPLTGKTKELGKGAGLGYNVNVPIPRYTEDEDMLFIFEELVLPLIERFKPDVLFLQAGADGHKDDPLTSLFLTTGIYDRIGKLLKEAPVSKYIITGGGGYDIVNVARIWSILWGRITGQEIPDILPDNFLRISIMEGYDGPSIWDTPNWTGDRVHIKPVIRERVEFLKREVGL
ncbi:acetoin utilization protein AcuC [Thermosulfidibacter takaii ABI70S6]|uniref:Acetoin utilization protein AcuC n=1 Tax=Thermosulfidibacter takaii (strain DSM 17441 / JCM 13301 / NBRC 103674 / ABI70S6) TaxID=1298851 RepID=A0A0S3QTQ1_THET7|nr:acetoin utilization protein AcuC [Thermosulfidibacter takaii]BAT71711.1 acetoin utilization protein AcuC [Thermosulfidibacter takaii ABI70S6]